MTCVGLYFSKSALVASALLQVGVSVRARYRWCGERPPEVSLSRAGENPRLAITTPVARVRRIRLEDVLDGISDEALAASNENDVWHGCVYVALAAGERGGIEIVKATSEGGERG